MPWIEEVDLPTLPAIFRAMSLNSQALEAVEQLNESLAFGLSTLGRVQEEAIATAVSVANRCRYGALTHGGFLRRFSGDPTLASQILSDYTKADLTPKDRRMLDFAVRVTLEPGTLSESDVDGLRAAGFDDQDILSIVLVASLFNFMNRVANSLGVEVTLGFQRAMQSWLEEPANQEAWLFDPSGEPDRETMGKAAVLPSAASEQESDLQVPTGQRSIQVAFQEQSRRQFTGLLKGSSEEAPLAYPAQAGFSPASLPRVGAADNDSPEEPPSEESDTISGGGAPKRQRISSLPRFLEDCCNVSSGDSATARDLYIAYLRWCDENHWGPLLQRGFGIGLANLGFRRRRRGHGRHWWLGIGLKSEEVED